MERRYAPLRPWSPGAEAKELEREPDPSSEMKGVRVSVSVACNNCRRRKTRCDGLRPICSNCRDKKSRCEYRNEKGLSKESKSLIVEMVQMLGRLPSAETLQYLDELKNEADAAKILSTLRGGLTSKQPEADTSTRAPNTDINDPINATTSSPGWQTPYPKAYPGIAGRYVDVFQTDSTYEVMESSTRDLDLPHADNLVTDQQSAHLLAYSAIQQDEEVMLELCDPRLRKLNIRHWTNVNIDNELATRCISLYLETDHPLLGHFNPDLFVSDLTSEKDDYCSSLLVNSLLYWACQMYSALDPQTDQLAIFFCEEAEQHWMDERGKGNDSMIILAATEFLCLGYLGQGRDHSVLRYLTEAANMADRMALFTTEGPMDGKRITAHINTVGADKTALMYTAWGIFGWLTLMSLFYHQPGILCPKFPPRVPIPKRDTLDVSNGAFGHSTENVPSLPVYMGDTFTYLCRFWTIMREVSWVYHTQGQQPWGLSGASEFAEFKFRELLAWSNSLPDQLSAYEHSQHHHVQVMHLWLHSAVLDIFRPLMRDELQRSRCLKTFNNNACTPKAICHFSTLRLKRLIVNYRLNFRASSFTFLWHTALIYVANALLQNEKGGNWYSCLLLCLYGYQKLSRSWRVAEAITKGILSMTLRKGDISSIAARRILLDFKNRTPDSISGGIRATFMVDLDRALSEPSSATVEYLASQFEGNAILDEYTNIFDNSKRREER